MQELQFTNEEEDLGVITDSKLKFSSHMVNQVEKGNRLMGLIRRSYNFLEIVSFKYLFISLVRPHLEYCVTIWYPPLKKMKIRSKTSFAVTPRYYRGYQI